VRRLAALVIAVATLSACATFPENAYYPLPGDPQTRVLAEALYRAARAASEDPQRYSFAMVRTAEVRAYTGDDDATFYFSEGLARRSSRVVDALVAHEVAHELLDHVGSRRVLSRSVTGGFIIVRAHTREQEIAADRKAVEVLRDMGYSTPRRTLADALREAAALNSPADRGSLATEPELGERLAALEPLEPAALGR